MCSSNCVRGPFIAFNVIKETLNAPALKEKIFIKLDQECHYCDQTRCWQQTVLARSQGATCHHEGAKSPVELV